MGDIRHWCAASVVLLAALAAAVASDAPRGGSEESAFIRLPPLEASGLQTYYRENWKNTNMSDEKNGVLIEVIDRSAKNRAAFPIEGVISFTNRGGVEWVSDVTTTPRRVEKILIRKNTDTFRYLIRTPAVPPSPRYLAVMYIHSVPFSDEERLALLELASRDPVSGLRWRALLEAERFEPEADVVPIYARALTDPCVRVAHHACGYLVEFFDLRDEKTGERLACSGRMTGAPEWHYWVEHDQVFAVAEAMEAAHPELVTEEDLASIRSRRVPSEEWWQTQYGETWTQLSGQRWETKRDEYVRARRRDDLETRRATLCSVRAGMTEDQVLEILGKPDEVRARGEVGAVAEKYRWVYGTDREGQFPRVGSVMFGDDDKVCMVHCPSRVAEQMLPANTWPPFLEHPQKTSSGMYCSIDKVFRNPEFDNAHYMRVSLVNSGQSKFSYRHDHTGIRFSLMVEVYDADRILLLREPLHTHHSPRSADPSQWPVLKVPPGSRVSEDVPIWWKDVNDGALHPGVYYIRVAFPFEKSKFYRSGLTKWELRETLGKRR